MLIFISLPNYVPLLNVQVPGTKRKTQIGTSKNKSQTGADLGVKMFGFS